MIAQAETSEPEAWESLPLVVNPEEHIKLVHHTVRRLYPHKTDEEYEDLAGAGMIGLLRACRTFDASTGHKFSTHAVWWIRGYASKHNRRERYNAGEVLDKPKGEKQQWTRIAKVGSLHSLVDDEGESVLDVPDRVGSAEPEPDLLDAIRPILKTREFRIIEGRVFKGETHQAIGDEIGLTRERIRQIETEAKQKIAAHFGKSLCRRRDAGMHDLIELPPPQIREIIALPETDRVPDRTAAAPAPTQQPPVNNSRTIPPPIPAPVDIAEHLPQVSKIAAGYFNKHPEIEVDELLRAGHIGLQRAAQTFTPSLGHSFALHAGWKIRGAIAAFVATRTQGRVGGDMSQLSGMFGSLREHLNERQALVIEGLFVQGLSGIALGKTMGISAARVYQIRDRAVSLLRAASCRKSAAPAASIDGSKEATSAFALSPESEKQESPHPRRIALTIDGMTIECDTPEQAAAFARAYRATG